MPGIEEVDMNDVTLVNQISDIIYEVAKDYQENFDDWTTSDFQGLCMAKAMAIIKAIKEV